MAATVAVAILVPGTFVAVAAAVLVWGFFFASWLIVVNTWVGHRMPDRLEAGGSLVVTGFQGAITLAAAIGGLVLDLIGVEAVYAIGVASLLIGAVLFGRSHRVRV
jgi:predicted MFS family arabinose efflux permease